MCDCREGFAAAGEGVHPLFWHDTKRVRLHAAVAGAKKIEG